MCIYIIYICGHEKYMRNKDANKNIFEQPKVEKSRKTKSLLRDIFKFIYIYIHMRTTKNDEIRKKPKKYL